MTMQYGEVERRRPATRQRAPRGGLVGELDRAASDSLRNGQRIREILPDADYRAGLYDGQGIAFTMASGLARRYAGEARWIAFMCAMGGLLAGWTWHLYWVGLTR